MSKQVDATEPGAVPPSKESDGSTAKVDVDSDKARKSEELAVEEIADEFVVVWERGEDDMEFESQTGSNYSKSHGRNVSGVLEDTSSIGGWSEISAPSQYLGSPMKSRKRAKSNSDKMGEASEAGEVYHDGGGGSSVRGSQRVPFSWAEVTKINPKFHKKSPSSSAEPGSLICYSPIAAGESAAKLQVLRPHEADEDTDKEKQQLSDSDEKKSGSDVLQSAATAATSPDDISADETKKGRRQRKKKSPPLRSIPEFAEDSFVTKADLGRTPRRAGKKQSRVKYPNGKRGSRKNSRRR